MNVEAIITTIATAATLLAAIFSPVLTTKMNNQHQLEMEKLKAQQKIKNEVILGFVRSADEIISHKGAISHDEYDKWKNVIFIYIEPELADSAKYVVHCIRALRFEEASHALTAFCYSFNQLGKESQKGNRKNP